MGPYRFLFVLLLAMLSLSVSGSKDKGYCCKSTFSQPQQAFLRKMLQDEARQLQSGMMQMCPKPTDKWVKLSPTPVCFGANGRQFGSFSVPLEGFVAAIKLVYVSGSVTCDQSNSSFNSNWGCDPSHPSVIDGRNINTLVTKASDSVIFPCQHDLKEGGGPLPALWYKLENFHSKSPVLVMTKFDKPVFVSAAEQLRLWYGEDLTNTGSANNSGQTCANVFGWYL